MGPATAQANPRLPPATGAKRRALPPNDSPTATRETRTIDTASLQAIVSDTVERSKPACGRGQVATYIPELAKANGLHLGLAVHPVEDEPVACGDAAEPFTLQSVSKLFALAYVMQCGCGDLWERVGQEPSGDAFHSIVLLEEEHGRPRNPFINAGAIVTSALMPGDNPEERIAGFQGFLRRITGSDGFAVNNAVYDSESRTGYRNRALAHYMRHFEVLPMEPAEAVDTYFRQCAIEATTVQLARAALFIANNGTDPLTGEQVLTAEDNRTLVALMTHCGLYDQVGEFAVDVGLPAKSGVSGDIVAVAPGRYTIAAWGPALGPKGNSIGAMQALALLARELGLTIYG